MANRPLPSIRGRIVAVFVAYGFVLSLLVMFAMAVSTSADMALYSLLLVFLLILAVGWQIGTYMSRDLRRLSQAVSSADTDHLLKKAASGNLPKSSTAEVQEVSDAFSRFAKKVGILNESLKEETFHSAQSLDEMSGTLQNFMYHVAHTLRTPLNAIRWTVETLKNEDSGKVTEEQRELLDKLEYSSIKLLSLADELQDTLIVARGDALQMHPAACDIREVIDDVAGRLAVFARQKHVRIDWDPPAYVPEVLCDSNRMRQVLHILIDNAIRYTKANSMVGIELKVIGKQPTAAQRRSLVLPADVRDAIVIVIKDEGIGIPKADQPRIFEPFFRAKNAKEVWVDGKGAGLSLTQSIVLQTHGNIWITSKENQGTTVYISLPLAI